MATIKKAIPWQAPQPVAFFDHTKECDMCDGCGWSEGGKALKTHCATCNGTGKTGLKWQTKVDEENKITGFVITHNGRDTEFAVVKNDILKAFQKAEVYFSKLKI